MFYRGNAVSQLKTRNVFLDTQVYFASGFNLSKTSLARLTELCQEDLVKLYVTNIVKSECRAHLREAVKKATNGLRAFQRHGVILRNISSGGLPPLFANLEEDSIQQQAWSQFEDYLTSCKAIEVSCKDVNPEEIFDRYFRGSSPFGTGKKKSEFPDAFSFSSVAQTVGDDKCYLVTGDSDGKDLEDQRLIQIDSLEKFLDLFNRAEEALTEQLVEALSNSTNQLEQEVKEALACHGAYSDAEPDAEVTEFSVDNVKVEEVLILKVRPRVADLSVWATVEYSATLQEPAYDTATYDREDDFYIFHDDPHVYDGSDSDTFKINVTVNFDEVQGTVEIDGFSQIALEGNSMGFPVSITRDDYPYK